MNIHLVYITVANKAEALSLASSLVHEKLLACANITESVHSIYWWENAVEEAQEAVIIGKTTEAKVPELIARVKALHSYSCPGVVTVKLAEGNPAFMEWVEKSLGSI
jgi:periplasmic divalent cation tolerance protein